MQNESKRKATLQEELEKIRGRAALLEEKYSSLTKAFYDKKLLFDTRAYDYIKLKDIHSAQEIKINKLLNPPFKSKTALIPCEHNKNSGDSLKVLKDCEIIKLKKENKILKSFVKKVALELNFDDEIFIDLEEALKNTKDKNLNEFVNEHLFKYRKKKEKDPEEM